VATGTSVDWVFNELGVNIGYTIEYRDKGRYGFILPPVQIIPNCEELMVGMLALVEKTKELGYPEKVGGGSGKSKLARCYIIQNR